MIQALEKKGGPLEERRGSLYAAALAAFGASLAVSGCLGAVSPGRAERSRLGDCDVGAAACACTVGLTCDAGLACEHGLCVPTDCTRATADCACGSQGECGDPAAGLGCMNGVCRQLTPPAAGSLGGACGDTTPCGTEDGEQLACTGGVCERPSCPSGEAGCPCDVGGACGSLDGQSLRCFDGVCTRGRCAEGTLGCLCASDAECASGYVCTENLCRRADAAGLSVASPAARACDVLLGETRVGRAPVVRFAPGLQGEQVYRSRKLALSFMGTADAPMPSPAASVEAQSGSTAAFEVQQVECYDGLGRTLAQPEVLLR